MKTIPTGRRSMVHLLLRLKGSVRAGRPACPACPTPLPRCAPVRRRRRGHGLTGRRSEARPQARARSAQARASDNDVRRSPFGGDGSLGRRVRPGRLSSDSDTGQCCSFASRLRSVSKVSGRRIAIGVVVGLSRGNTRRLARDQSKCSVVSAVKMSSATLRDRGLPGRIDGRALAIVFIEQLPGERNELIVVQNWRETLSSRAPN